MEIPSLKTVRETIERWILTCNKITQLNLLMSVVEEFVSFERYPDAPFDDINGAQITLYMAIDLKARQLKQKAVA